MYTTIFILLLVLLGYLISLLMKPLSYSNTRKTESKPAEYYRLCPLCNHGLKKGENVHSVVYASSAQDKSTEIWGCPYCRPPKGREIRRCPRCESALSDKQYVLARTFQKPGKTHVHVLGCSNCYKPRSGR
jgi:uncharacterized protein with PIN domain